MARPVISVVVGMVMSLALVACGGSTTPPTNVTAYSAALGGQGECDGGSPTPCYWYWRYGTGGQYQYQTPVQGPYTGSTGGLVQLSAPVTGLQPDTTYQYQLCGEGDTITSYVCVGPDGTTSTSSTFTTSPRTMPPDTTSGLGLGQPFNYGESVVNGVVQGEQGVLDYVAGARCSETGCTGSAIQNISGGPGVWHDGYLPWQLDHDQHTIQWFQENHPTWVEYQYDGGPPATVFGLDTPTLDTTNPDVQVFIEGQADDQLANGFPGLEWDDMILVNQAQAEGHYDANGNWVQQYSGSPDDPTFIFDQAAAFAAVAAGVRAFFPTAEFQANQRFTCNGWSSLPNQIDMIMDEGAFTYSLANNEPVTTAAGEGCSNLWLATVLTYVAMQKNDSQGLFLDNEEPYQVTAYMTDSNATARANLEYALANYFLVKYSHTYFWWGGEQQYGGPPVPQTEYGPANTIGSPADDVYGSQGVYMRDYTNGLVIVNPDPSNTYTVTVPGGLQDLRGNAVGGSVTLPPVSGDVLLK